MALKEALVKVLSHARWLLLPLAAALMMLAYAPPASQAQSCEYKLGFADIYNQIPQIVGPCVSNEMYDAQGNSIQYTANGMMQWRKADNFTAFTDGYRSWVNGPCGLEMRLNSQRFSWEANPEGLPVVPSVCDGGAQPVQPIAPAPPPPVIQFSVDQNPVNQGSCTTLRWYTQNIDSVYLNGEGMTGEGSREVCPTEETTYTLDVKLTDGTTQSQQITVRVIVPDVRIDFYADDYSVMKGQCTTLHWNVENIESVYLNGEGVTGQGSKQVCPEKETTYTLEVKLLDGSTQTRQVTIKVAEPK